MKVQLEPLISELQADSNISFHFTQGSNPVNMPRQFEGFTGPPPNFTFIECDLEANARIMSAIDARGDPEDTMRIWQASPGSYGGRDITPVLSRLLEQIDQDNDIEGIIGYSEGAGVAASLIVEESKRMELFGRIPRLKSAIFIAGLPPMDSGTGRFLLRDEVGYLIKIPTCHIVGTQDTMICGAMALYNVCDCDTADLFDHGGGHSIPRDSQTLKELATTIQSMIASV
ncbi:hypothetical protein N7495_005566 [Penicillium taxi]|uniref:uncharacterized protein n=1 Tax=Penicillium taxi TaxID=168475 RepID=UPI0025453BEF|nr:uncharacterized protein N7495_005566 [Penicillium taxi]KAJ5893875.1 hypothetical protein N7495_005566 [Penicillium taxi]